MTPESVPADPLAVSREIRRLQPAQGGFALKYDRPGEVHDWHRHGRTEEIFVISGKVLLFWSDDGCYRQRACAGGTWLTLAAGVPHGSVAGRDGAVYLVRPEHDRTAETIVLPPEAQPHPTPHTAEE